MGRWEMEWKSLEKVQLSVDLGVRRQETRAADKLRTDRQTESATL